MTAEMVINHVFACEPDAIVIILENENTIAVLFKEDWESEKFIHIKAKCKKYNAPEFIERGQIPLIGIVIRINLQEAIQ